MGIDLNAAQLLIKAHKGGLSFGRMATLGRQGLHANRPALISVLRASGYDVSKDRIRKLLDPTTEYSEEFFSVLGVQEIVAIDASGYEGAQIVHDMNRPIPDGLISCFDIVLDGGTLEHVFDFPTALRNATMMVRPNGQFISICPANNLCGHGFYQFSPELFYRFLCPRNGYSIECCIIWEDIPGSKFYEVPDPDSLGSRITLTSEFGTNMIVRATRKGAVSQDFIPQQSDYLRLWAGPVVVAKGRRGLNKLKSTIKGIQILRSAFGGLSAKASYRRMRIKRNAQRALTPLHDLCVRH